MKIGIVTVTYNSAGVLEDFFSSLERQDFKEFFLYIVDSGSTDETVSYAASHMPAGGRLIENKDNIGFAAGTNLGIHAALEDGCSAVLIMNNDVVFGPDLISQLALFLTRNDCDMTTPLMYFHDPSNRIWAAGGTFITWRGDVNLHRGMGQKDIGQYNSPERVAFAPLCCVLIRRKVFDTIGLLDEEFFTYAEDADFMYRCMKRGISLWYVPNAKLWHKVSSLTGNLSDFAIRYSIRGRFYFLHKHLSSFAAWFWTLAHFIDFALQFVLMKNSKRVMILKYRAALEGYRVYRKAGARGEKEAETVNGYLLL